MDILGIDISKAKFDMALLIGDGARHSTHPNTQLDFKQMLAWLGKHRSAPFEPLHACMEATGNYGIDLADLLFSCGVSVSIVNPARMKAFASSELARNKTDKLDAALIARFCRAHVPLHEHLLRLIFESFASWIAGVMLSKWHVPRNLAVTRLDMRPGRSCVHSSARRLPG